MQLGKQRKNNIEIQNIKFISVTNDIFEKEEKHFITLYIIADYKSGEVKNIEPDKLEGWEWFECSNLPEPKFLPLNNLIKESYKIINDMIGGK